YLDLWCVSHRPVLKIDSAIARHRIYLAALFITRPNHRWLRQKPPRCSFGLLPRKGAFFALGRPGGKKSHRAGVEAIDESIQSPQPALLAASADDASRKSCAKRCSTPPAS